MIKINKPKLPLRQVIGIGISLFFLITLWGANRWANYRQIFEVQEIAISGYEILDKKITRTSLTNLISDLSTMLKCKKLLNRSKPTLL